MLECRLVLKSHVTKYVDIIKTFHSPKTRRTEFSVHSLSHISEGEKKPKGLINFQIKKLRTDIKCNMEKAHHGKAIIDLQQL